MLALASILSAFAAIVCLYFRAPERAKAGRFPHSAAERKVLGVAAIGGLAASLVLAVVALGRAAGIGLWLVALMATGVAVVSIAGNHPVTARWLGYAMRLPEAGSRLELVDTFGIATPGQAIDWDPQAKRRLWSIGRGASEVVASEIRAVR